MLYTLKEMMNHIEYCVRLWTDIILPYSYKVSVSLLISEYQGEG